MQQFSPDTQQSTDGASGAIRSAQAAFTLVELMITSTITALILLAMSNLFISYITSAYKSRISQELRSTGSNAMQQMIQQLRSAGAITTENCDSGVGSLSFVGVDGLVTTFAENNDKIASSSAENGTFYLTTSQTPSQDRLKNLTFTCYETENAKYVGINFTLQSGSYSIRNLSSSVLDFSSGVALRN